jgi:Spy/CpxP family protein refolding chaperone
MIAGGRPELHIVGSEPQPGASDIRMHQGRPATHHEQMMMLILPHLALVEALAMKLNALMDEQRKELAKERGVAFIRPEQIRAEFGGA